MFALEVQVLASANDGAGSEETCRRVGKVRLRDDGRSERDKLALLLPAHLFSPRSSKPVRERTDSKP